VWQKQLEKWHNGDWFHHYHTVPAHPLSLQEFLDNNGKIINLHPLDSGCGTLRVFPFPKIKLVLGDRDFIKSAYSRTAGYIFRVLNTGCSKFLSKITQSLSFLNSFSRGLL
jgi:hypothetical protein